MKLSRFLSIVFVASFFLPAFVQADQLSEAKAALDSKDYKKAYELLSPLAEAGNVDAETKLGIMYVNGQGVEADFNKGLKLIMAAANKGYESAQTAALNVSLEIAKSGNTSAMYNVGGMCLKGWGGEQDKSVCLQWLEGAARLGHIHSGEMLSDIYKKGEFGIAPDKEKAAAWKAVAKGFKKGMTGTWAGSIPGMGGQPMRLSFTFSVKNNTLKGTTMGAQFKKIPLEDCEIDGNKFSFKVVQKWQDKDMTQYYTGTFYGDALQMSLVTDMGNGKGPGRKFIAKRSNF